MVMWTILKINRKELSLLRFDLTKKLGRDYEPITQNFNSKI